MCLASLQERQLSEEVRAINLLNTLKNEKSLSSSPSPNEIICQYFLLLDGCIVRGR